MKFTIPKQELQAALGAIQGCVESKATIPVLRNTLIESVSESAIQLTATNLDISIRKDAAADVGVMGSICIPSRKLFDVVKNLPDADITIEKEKNDWVTLKCGKGVFKFAGVAKDQFPDLPEPKELAITLNGDLLASMVTRTIFAITAEAGRFTLAGAKFIVKGGTATMVATDGHRLAFIEKTPADGQPSLAEHELDVLIPRLALNEVAKMSGDIRIGQEINHIFFETDGQMLSARKLTGSFPNYQMVLPKDNDHTAIVDGPAFKACVRRIALMSDPRNASMRITAAEGELRLMAASSEEGEGNETLEAEYGAEEMLLGFNWHYLGEFLNLVTDEKVVIQFKDPNAQVELQIAGDEGFRYIVMPLRV